MLVVEDVRERIRKKPWEFCEAFSAERVSKRERRVLGFQEEKKRIKVEEEKNKYSTSILSLFSRSFSI